MLNVALPVLVSVTDCAALVVPTAWLGNKRLAGERLTAGAVPVPLRLTVCGLLLALSVMVRTPVRVPVAVGVKVTRIEQFAPGATELPQVLVWAKSPLVTMLAIVSGALPVLVSRTVLAALVEPTTCLLKVKLVVDSDTV